MKKVICIFLILNFANISFCQDTWLQLDDFEGEDREAATVFTINGKAFAGLGFNQDGMELSDFKKFDPGLNTWEDIAPFPGIARLYAKGFSIGNYGYVVGGYQSTNFLYDVWEYDSINDSWSQKADYPGKGSLQPGVFVIEGKGYVVGGQSENGLTKETWEFDPIANSWEQKTDFPGEPRCKMMNFTFDNFGYIGLGGPTFPMFGTFEKDLYAYDPINDTWTQKADSPFIGIGLVSTFVIDDIAYSVSGSTFDLLFTDLVFAYDPMLDEWSQKGFFEGFDRHHSTGFSIGDKGYLIFGHSIETGFMKELWEYSPNMVTPISKTKEEIFDISIFPNPTQGIIHISKEEEKIEFIKVYSLLGELKSEFQNKNNIDISGFPKGFYFLEIITKNNNRIVKKVLKED